MNFLAHAYLSFNDPEVLVGNMISDFVKGKKKFDFSPGIQKGIALHRAIDTFTDEHATTKAAKEIFRPHYRLYSAAFTDVVYDHFLATDTRHFNNEILHQFATKTYNTLSSFTEIFPEDFARMFPYMQEQNWLYNYQYHWGIEKSLGGVVRRAAYLNESDTAYRLFLENYELLNEYYDAFFPDLFSITHQEFAKLQ
jgi:acyl carrier protein phosphodiesterase